MILIRSFGQSKKPLILFWQSINGFTILIHASRFGGACRRDVMTVAPLLFVL